MTQLTATADDVAPLRETPSACSKERVVKTAIAPPKKYCNPQQKLWYKFYYSWDWIDIYYWSAAEAALDCILMHWWEEEEEEDLSCTPLHVRSVSWCHALWIAFWKHVGLHESHKFLPNHQPPSSEISAPLVVLGLLLLKSAQTTVVWSLCKRAFVASINIGFQPLCLSARTHGTLCRQAGVSQRNLLFFNNFMQF